MHTHYTYLSAVSGARGTIKTTPDDFLVEEIGLDGRILELNQKISPTEGSFDQNSSEHRPKHNCFIHFVLQKKNWSTSSALSEIANRIRIGHANFNIAGTKDKISVSTQLASVRSVTKTNEILDVLLGVKIKDISINGAWPAPDRVHLGDLLGNRFTITVRGHEPDIKERTIAISADLGGKFPNYFGEQRFGSSRKNTHLVGRKILQGDLEGALDLFLCSSDGEKNEFAVDARKRLAKSQDYAMALREYPKHLRLERSIIAYLVKNPKNHAGALRRLPRNILLLFVHAFQSSMFNTLLSERLAEGEPELEMGEYFCGETSGFPDINKSEGEGWIAAKLIGYSSPLNTRETLLLEELGISKDAFKLKLLPEISSKGSYRAIFSPLKDFSLQGSTFRFSLAAGSYATVALREFLDAKHS